MNHAALAPISYPVKAAIDAFILERHRTNIENYFDFRPIIHSAKQKAAELLCAQARQIAFVSNTSHGLNVLAQGLKWEAGDRILVPGCEFPANVYPFMQLESKQVAVDFVPHHEGTFSLHDIESAIKPQTRLLTISWVQFLSGFRADLSAIGALCKSRNILFCVDAIQGLGALEIDVDACGIDFLASGGHKWLMAMQGIGLIYVAPSLLEQLKPAAGWLHGPIDWAHLIDYKLLFHNDARRFMPGTYNSVGIAALHAALAFYQQAGPRWCEQQVLTNALQIRTGLAAMGFEIYGASTQRHASGIVTVKHSRASEIFDRLKVQSIHIAVRNGLLRFAPSYYNSAEEVDVVLQSIKKLLGEYPV